jgi:hypothetical protein
VKVIEYPFKVNQDPLKPGQTQKRWWFAAKVRCLNLVLTVEREDLLECRIGYAVLNVLHSGHVTHAIDCRKAACQSPKPLPDQR